MAGLAHLGVGFAMKWAAPKAPVTALVVGAELLDLLTIPEMLARQSDVFIMVTTHGLAAALIWSALAGRIAALAKLDLRSSLWIGLAVFSHWILDFITHPMGALFADKASPDLPLLGPDSPRVGLGLYNHSYALAMAFDLGVTILGIAAYVGFKVLERRRRAA
jgi:membrane-bound metal-dependent hydrolase YbcI (DUF457 family)